MLSRAMHRLRLRLAPLGGVVIGLGLLAGQWAARPVTAANPGDDVDFERDVLPILKDNCFECHAGKAARSGLHLNFKIGMTRGGNFGPAVVPNKPEESGILARLRGDKGLIRMPLGKPALPTEQIGRIERWIRQGAGVPPQYEGTLGDILHWAYVAPVKPPLPAVKNVAWVRNPIDRFVLSKLDSEGLTPSPEADRLTLVRRLYLDLLGLPPTPAQADAFVNDPSPDAFEKLVDQLLASPHYGERWARPWLDLARYADSQGYEKDRTRTMWPYRDWVIKALNADMPFDQFTVEQLAGDLLPNPSQDQLIATGFHRNSMLNEEGGVDPDESFYNNSIERANVTATVWLGSTLNCAQCHNHKFDPFSMRDYYRLYAFFNSAAAEQKQGRGSENADISPRLQLPLWDDAAVKKRLEEIKSLPGDKPKAIEEEQKALESKLAGGTKVYIMKEVDPPRESFMHARGAFLSPEEKVTPGTPRALPPMRPGLPANRLGLAKWLMDAENPLVGRVVVNRLWEWHFGTGIVQTSEDLGTQSSPPTHPELLDWLATEMIEKKWSMKAMHRLIVTSATYRQSSRVTPELLEKDPRNRLLARGPRFRLDGEFIRDQALAVSGLLSDKMYGPGVMPYQPDGIWNTPYSGERWTLSGGEDRYRRGIYTFWKRAAPYPTFVTFDAPSRENICTRRPRTNTALQALNLLNDPAFMQPAAALARRVQKEGGQSVQDQVTFAFRQVLIRPPKQAEIDRLAALYTQQLLNYQSDIDAAKKVADSGLGAPAGDPSELAAWTIVCNVLLNLDETINRG